MKINRLVSAIFFFVVGLFSLASLQAQEAKTLFVNIPDSLTPLLTKVNREDCIDFLESKMKAQVENRFGKKSEMTELGTDYVRMQMSPQTSWQMKVLALSDSELTLTLTTPDYMAKETAEKLKPFLRRPIVYHWKNGVFTK